MGSRVRSRVSRCLVFDGQSGTLKRMFLAVLQFSPVSINTQVLHIHLHLVATPPTQFVCVCVCIGNILDRVFPAAVRQVLKYEPESQLRPRYRGDLQECEDTATRVIEVSSMNFSLSKSAYNYFYWFSSHFSRLRIGRVIRKNSFTHITVVYLL
jgi:hypothetical protein